MAYLVTGGTGFIGGYVARDLLNAGKEVVCLQRSATTPLFLLALGEENVKKVKIVQIDISDTLRVFNTIRDYKIDYIIHTASQVLSNGETEAQPYYALQVNCGGIVNLLEAAKVLGVKKITWTSSAQALGSVSEVHKELIKDEAIYQPATMYGATKAMSEFIAKHYYDKFGVDSAGFRIGIILNIEQPIGRRRGFIDLMRNAALNIPMTFTVPDADRVRALGYVENVADLLIQAVESPTTKRIFNAIEFQLSPRELVETINKINPKAKITLKAGVPMQEAIWGGTPDAFQDTSALRQELKWPKYNLKEALKKMFNYFRQQENLPLL